MDPDIGGAKGGRGDLHPQATGLVQHHRDVARTHQQFFLDLLSGQHLDAHRLILYTTARTRCLNDDFLQLLGLVTVRVIITLTAGSGRHCHY